MNKPGFTIIELLVSTLIAGIVAGILFTVLRQANRVMPAVDSLSQLYEKAALINAQLERDLAGVTVPLEFYARQKKKKEEKPPVKEEASKKSDEETKKQEEEKKKKAAAQQEEENEEGNEQQKPLQKVFYSINKGDLFDQLSFITTSSLQVYWGTITGSARPRIVRVMYQLKPEENKKPNAKKSYKLVRKETNNLEYNAVAKESAEQVVATGIKSMAVEFVSNAVEQEQDEKQKKEKVQKKQSAQKKERETRNDFSRVEQDEESNDGEKKLPLVPQLVSFKMNLWDTQQRKSFPFIFTMRIPAQVPEKITDKADITERMIGTMRDLFSANKPHDQQGKAQPPRIAQNSPQPGARRR